jgi:polysaccharide export outer membrane protein
MTFDRLNRTLVSLFVVLAFGLASVDAGAQTPTAEQLKVFQSLPKEQRDAILQQMGVSGGGSATSARGGASSKIVVQQPGQGSTTRATTQPYEFGAPERRIKGDEQLLIELVLPSENGTQTITEITPDGRQVTKSQTTSNGQGIRSAEDQRRLTDLRNRIIRRNPYVLSSSGVLQLPGLDPIALGGLSEKEVQERLALDPALRDFTVAVTVLRVDAQGARALKPFGYDMFKGTSTAFVPGTDIPVPDDYRLGPGDVMDVQLYGQKSQTYTLPVGRDGSLSFPDLGPINVGGMNFSSAKSLVEGRVRQQMIGTQARVTLSELRSVRVLVLGDAEQPGSYVVSSLSTVTNALFASGGVKPIGSLRNIQVKRDGRLIRSLDLYDVLLKGDTANDVRLQTGDAVFVPPVGPTVAVEGEVRRPAIYELTGERSVEDVVSLAGGLTSDADGTRMTVERVGSNGRRTVLTFDPKDAAGAAIRLRAGDVLRVMAIRPVFENAVRVEGYVHRPGTFSWREGMRLSELLPSIDELKPGADTHYLLIRREDPRTRRVTVVSADLQAALASTASARDTVLQPRDTVFVFDKTSPRSSVLDPILEELSRQGDPAAPTTLVTVGGRVNSPGRYPLEPGMRIGDLVRAGGGLEDAAYPSSAELTRYYVANGERRRADLQTVDLGAALAGDAAANVELQPYDVLTIKEMPEWSRVEQIDLAGEVRFPGKYQIRRGETLRSVIERAGGLSPLAFAAGAVFTREDLRQREREQLDRLASRLQSDIATLALQSSQTNPAAGQAVAAGQSLLDQLRQTQPVGRLVIDLDSILNSRTPGENDVVLRGGDRILIPRLAQEVSVLGEVQNPTSHLFRAGLTRDDVLALSGGVTARADVKRTYVVRADGSVVANASKWFGRGDLELRPGDAVVVPLDAEKMRPLPLWTAVTTIIYNLAIAAAAVATF